MLRYYCTSKIMNRQIKPMKWIT